MTNLLTGLAVMRLITNLGPTTIHGDAASGVPIREQTYTVSAEVAVGTYTKAWQPSKLPLPTSRWVTTPIQPPPSATLAEPLVITAAVAVDTNCMCCMVAISFLSKTNQIYGLERSRDLVTWEPRPPEVDGEGATEMFLDVLDVAAVYRVASRPGVLPTGAP